MGFAATQLNGSQHNDAFVKQDGKVRTATNRSGGIQGGITNGEFIYFRVAFKPVATIFKPQQSVNRQGEELTMQPKGGRHDPCVLPRAVPMVEAMASLVIMDHYLRQIPVAEARGPHRV
jgi:chorismate synthase